MFRRDHKDHALIDTLVSASTRIRGDVEFSGGLQLEGSVAGNVRASADLPSRLVISESAVVDGSVTVQVLELHGAVRGDIRASGRVKLGPQARVEGDLHYGAIEMAAGAHIKGRLIRLTGNETSP